MQVPLGEYRTAASRGAGTVHCFMVRSALPTQQKLTQPDLEQQRVVRLSRGELTDALLAGKFKEVAQLYYRIPQLLMVHVAVQVKWTATIALALLHGDREIVT